MGSCISKCKPNKKFKEDCNNHVHDKLVISQDPIPSTIPIVKEKRDPSPAPSSSSTSSSFSSFSCSNSKCTSKSSSSSSSCSSSQPPLIEKDRSFSNEFLWSCVKQNPQIIGLNPEKNLENKVQVFNPKNLEPSSMINISTKLKQSTQERPRINASSTPKKRARSNSPTITRQKSFRKDQNSVSSIPNRGLRSPSPTRKFNVENNSRIFSTNGINDRRPIVPKGNPVNSAPSGLKRDSFRPPSSSPNRDYLIKDGDLLKKRDVFSHQISTKIDCVDVGDIRCKQDMDTVMEDVNNPLIALDCFIFL